MSCSIIFISLCLLRVSFNVIFPVGSVSLPRMSDWPEKTSVIQVIVLVQVSHLWVKYLFFGIWCSVGLIPEAVSSRYTTVLQGISEGIVLPTFSSWKPTKWKSHLSSLIIFFCPASKKPIAFNYSTFWSSLIICSSLTNARDSLEFNIHIGKLKIMLVTRFWIYWLKWDTIVL